MISTRKTLFWQVKTIAMEEFKIDSPEIVPQLFIEAWNKYDAEGIARLFVADADFVNVTGLWWQKREDIYRAHEYGLRVIFEQSTLKLSRTKVRYLTAHIAVVHARILLRDQTSPRAGVEARDRSTQFIFVVKRERDTWLCHAAQNTEIQPGKETFIRKENGDYEAVHYGDLDDKT